jgi:anti-sigma-K factor RskA
MTGSDAASNLDQNIEPGEIEALLPWYAAGTLRRRDRQRVEAALRQDAELAHQDLAHQDLAHQDFARQIELVREELAETIHLNETLGAPPPHVADRLMAAIDAETSAARKHVPGSVAGWLTGFFASLPPRTLAVAASFAVLAIALQAFMLVDVFTKPQGSSQLASLDSPHRHESFAMVRFAQAASAAEITNFLHNYQAALVDGPTEGGLYRVRIAMKSLAKEELGKIVARMRQERVVESAEPAETAEPAEAGK